MRSYEKYEPFSEEYEKEIQRTNAYVVYCTMVAINDGLNLSDDIQKAIRKLTDEIEKEIGNEEITVSLAPTN